MIVTSQYMNILARVALQNPDLLLHFLRNADSSPDVVTQFVDKWAGTKVNITWSFIKGSLTVSVKQRVANSTQWVSPLFYERTTQQSYQTSDQS